MSLRNQLIGLVSVAAICFGPADAAEISIVTGSVGDDLGQLQAQLKGFEQKSGHIVRVVTTPPSSSEQFTQFRLWMAAGSPDIDVYQIDVVWAPQLAQHFVDLSPHVPDAASQHFDAIIRSQTVDGKLIALPMFADAPALYYRRDLLEKHGEKVPATWEELGAVASRIVEAERAAGDRRLWGFVFQGAAYEGLTCNALEWIASHGGGEFVEEDGSISVFNEHAIKALETAHSWIGTIAPEGVLSYQEEESRGVWQTGNAVFMRNWPYAYALSNRDDSTVKGKFAVTTLPAGEGGRSAATLGGWNLGVSRYSQHQDAAIELVEFLTSEQAQKQRALLSSRLPTRPALYDDPDIASRQPIIPQWKAVLENAVPRPSAVVKAKYNEFSSQVWTAVHNTLAGKGTAADNLELLEVQLTRLQGGSSW
ncbi:ABC transporter substrate-binding protein [Mesorhizobium sp. L-8-10]|uniref:ABC transporter substrate-binding protein n=1 Tax=Mesorhizobium sp. L-8-10 TaxID=2744523 RepID=UPI00192630F4|nr:ABC transporter substrate-binding protein [Mesorhizobium sp. L-8-10]